MHTLVKNKYTKMYSKYFFILLSILQIHLQFMYWYLIKNTMQLYFWYTKQIGTTNFVLNAF